MGRYLAALTAAMLERLVVVSHGWPGPSEEFATGDDYDDHLLAAGAALSAWASDDSLSALHDAWHEEDVTDG